jgi:hypothetical protein
MYARRVPWFSMDSDLSPAERTVLNTLVAQTNEYQGEWTSRRSLYTNVVAHGSLSPDQAETAIAALLDEGYIEHRDTEFRLADGVDREPHPDKIQRDTE